MKCKMTFTNDVNDLNGRIGTVDLGGLQYVETCNKESMPMVNGWLFNGYNIKENRVHMEVLCLDVDKNISIVEFTKMFSKYEFYLYTSWNHSDELDRFRVFIPLEKHLLVEDEVWVHKNLLKVFEGVDESCLQSSHRFWLPSKKFGAEHISFKNDGKLFDVYKYYYKPSNRILALKAAKKLAMRMTKPKNCSSKKGLINYIKTVKFEDGNKHNQLVKIVYKLIEDYDLDEICDEVENQNEFTIDRSLLRNIN